jgi:hypothetical protein
LTRSAPHNKAYIDSSAGPRLWVSHQESASRTHGLPTGGTENQMITIKKANGALREAKQINYEPTFDADRRVQHVDPVRVETSTHVILARGEACFELFRSVPVQYLRASLSSDSSPNTYGKLFALSPGALLIVCPALNAAFSLTHIIERSKRELGQARAAPAASTRFTFPQRAWPSGVVRANPSGGRRHVSTRKAGVTRKNSKPQVCDRCAGGVGVVTHHVGLARGRAEMPPGGTNS